MADDLDSDYVPDELGDSDESSKSDNESGHQNVSENSLIEDRDANVSGNKIIFPSTTPPKRNVPKKIIYQCSLCTFQTPLRHKLKRHFIGCKKLKRRPQPKHRQVTSGANFKCEYCFFITKTLDKLKKHKQSHASLIDLGLIECSHCTFKFFTLDEYKQHMKGTSSLDGDNEQTMATPEYVDVSSGMWADGEGIAIKREVCIDIKEEGNPVDSIDESEKTLSNYSESLMTNEYPSYKEEYRSKTARSGKTRDRCSYSRHLKNTQNVKNTSKKATELLTIADNPLVCEICCREAENQLHLVVHVTLDHVKEGAPFYCLKHKCSFETVSRENMKAHLINVHKLEEKNFSPLSDSNSQLAQLSFRCSGCFLETRSELFMKIHQILIHAKDSEGPFQCPLSNCDSENATRHSLECHLKELHGLEMDEAHVSTSSNADQGNDITFLTCQACGHKSETEFQMKIHEALKHSPKDRKSSCPVEQCFFTTSYNNRLKRHLQRVHKLGQYYFKNYGNEHVAKKYKAVEKEETGDYIAKENVKEALEELSSPIDGEKTEGRNASKSSEKKRFECQLCDFGTNHRSSERRHQKYVHTKKRCVLCNKVIRGMFEMDWHKFVIHSDESDIDFWLLKCDLCDQWGSPMESYRHGASHALPKVTFHTEYHKIATGGYVTFLYSKRHKSELPVKEEKSEAEYCIAPSAMKVLDWTKSDDEEISGPLDKQGAVTVEFTEADNKGAESKKGKSGSVKNTKALGQDNLLIMKSEFWTCKECNYETQSESSLKFHKASVHRAKSKSAPHSCPQQDCSFTSKYKGNFRRHMRNVHKIKNSSLFVADNMSARDVKGKNVERLAAEHGEDLDKHPNCESETVVHQHYSKQMHHCPERPNCLFSTPRLSDLLIHFRQSHNIFSFCTQKYICPSVHCLFDTDKKVDLKKHLKYFHQIDEKKVLAMEDTILSMKTFVCSKCTFQTRDSRIFKEHYWLKHYTKKETLKSIKKNSQASCKWSLRCTLCLYETSLKRAAYKHGLRHYYENPNSKAKFYKFFKHIKRGILGFSYSPRKPAVSLIKRKMRRNPVHAIASNNILSKTSEDKGTVRKIKQDGEKTTRATKKTKHGPLKEVQADYPDHSPSDHCLKELKDEAPNTENLEQGVITKRRSKRTCSSNIKKGNTEMVNELQCKIVEIVKLKGNLDHDKPVSASEVEYSDGNEEQEVFYSTEQLNDIIGVTTKAQHSNKDNPDVTDSDWISALENEILNEDELSDTEGNEVIRIEVTEDDDEESDGYNREESSYGEAALDSFTSDLSSKNGKRKNLIPTRIKCKNEGCSYFCYDIEEIQRHAERCKKSPIHKIESKKEFLCQLCQTTLPDKNSLQSHILKEHISNIEGEIESTSNVKDVSKPKPRKKLPTKRLQSTKRISGQISFKCWMCNEVIYYRGTLVNHTYVHAREEDNFKLKVRFSKYIGDTRVDTIVINADPNYVPRESSNVPLYSTAPPKRKRRPNSAAVLDYDPNLTVYSCDECNFKTNLSATLTKHKGLHWTPEKDLAFKTGKWFTCGVCFFHCFDADTLKEHSEKHKSRPGGNINVKKVGLNSWYF